MLAENLQKLAIAAAQNEFPCRVMLEPMGVRINMWKRAEDGIFADYNYLFQWTQLDVIDEANIKLVLDSMSWSIFQLIEKRRKQKVQNDGD